MQREEKQRKRKEKITRDLSQIHLPNKRAIHIRPPAPKPDPPAIKQELKKIRHIKATFGN